MELKGGPPSHDAFSDLSGALDPEQLEVAMTKFVNALHPVQAFEPGADLVLGQMKVDGKSNETAAIPGLLEILYLAGRTAAADAMHTRREVSAQIVEKGGDYVLPAERNQKTLHEDVQVWFADPVARKEMLSCLHVGGGHGRIETRIATVSHDVGWLRERHDWPGLKAVGRIEAVRERKGKQERSVRCHIMGEDRMRNRTLSGPECLAALRRIGPDIVRLTDDDCPLKARMEIAAMSDEYLLGMLADAIGKF